MTVTEEPFDQIHQNYNDPNGNYFNNERIHIEKYETELVPNDEGNDNAINHISGRKRNLVTGLLLVFMFVVAAVTNFGKDNTITGSQSPFNYLSDYLYNTDNRRRLQQDRGSLSGEKAKVRIVIYSTSATTSSINHDELYYSSIQLARKQMDDLELSASTLASPQASIQVSSINYLLDRDEQRLFVQENCGSEANDRVQELQASNKQQWVSTITQWCALAKATSDDSTSDAVVFIDPTSPIILNSRFSHDFFTYLSYLVKKNKGSNNLPNVAVTGMEIFSETIHGSLIILQRTKANHEMANRMLKLSLSKGATFEALELNTLLFSQTLHSLIRKHPSHKQWYFLEHHCRIQPPRRNNIAIGANGIQGTTELHMFCPASSGYCCSIQDRHDEPFVVLTSRHLAMPFQILNHDHIMSPYNVKEATSTTRGLPANDEVPFISTISETVIPRPAGFHRTPTFYEMLEAKRCLPEDDACSRCLREKRGATCHSCGSFCHCYCKALCNPDERPHSRHVAKKLIITPPPYRRDPTRLIPRIVHQTWFEELTPSKYPNMSRLVQSFARSGWEYKFYTDAQAGAFLSTHFPPEVREAYDVLRPGAFKADLFRYCVLLIHGGVYADVDIQLETSLDSAIAPDIGFMVPIDEPGKPVHHQMCLWNGMIAAAPAHPFLAKAVETIINQVRNRFTSVDIDETFCEYHADRDKIKSPELSVLHAYDTLFTAGPCLLGSSINRVLGRPAQTSFHPGELKGVWDEKHSSKIKQGTSFVIGIPEDANSDQQKQARVPGRTIILHQNKWDMGAHRFTFVEENLVVAATDLPDSNDLNKQQPEEEDETGDKSEEGSKSTKREHYSNTHAKTGVYGVHNLYTDREIAYEDIQIFVDASIHTKAFLKPSAIISSS